LQEFLEVLCKEDNRLALKAAFVTVLAFHDVEVKVPQPVFLYIEKIGPVLKHDLG